MKKHVRIFLIPRGSDAWMSKELTQRIAGAAAELGVPPEELMAQFTVAAVHAEGVSLIVVVEFFVEAEQAKSKAKVA